MSRSLIMAAAALVALLGCSGEREADGGPPADLGPQPDLGPLDAGPPDVGLDAGPDLGPDQGPLIELQWGTGREEFRPIENGETLQYVDEADQVSLTHIEFAFRATVLEPGIIFVALDCTRQRDGFDEVCERTLLPWTATEGPNETIELLDQRLLIPFVNLDAIGEVLDVTVRLQDEAGLTVHGELEILVAAPAE